MTDLAARFVTATALSGTGQVVTGMLGASGVADYSLTASQTEFFAASVVATSGSPLQPRLALYDATGQLLIQSDRQRPGVPGAELDQHLQSGNYYLEVSAAITSHGPVADQGFQLTSSFSPSTQPFLDTFSLYEGFQSVAVADFNGDGRPDLVMTTHGSGIVSVLLGNGDGTFQQPERTYTVGGAVAAVADVNGDGRPDLVTANTARMTPTP